MIRLALLLATLACTLPAFGAEPSRVPLATCRPLPRADQCECSLASVEEPLTFAQASGLIEDSYRTDPDPLYEQTLATPLRDCVFGWQRSPPAEIPTVRLTQDRPLVPIVRKDAK